MNDEQAMQQYFDDMYGEPESHMDNRWLNIARQYFPGATDDEIEAILYQRTAYPFYAKGASDEYFHKKSKSAAKEWTKELFRRKLGAL